MKKTVQLSTIKPNGHCNPVIHEVASSFELFDLLMEQKEPLYNLWYDYIQGWLYLFGSPKAWADQQAYRSEQAVDDSHHYLSDDKLIIIDESRTDDPDYLAQLAVAAWEAIEEYESTHTPK